MFDERKVQMELAGRTLTFSTGKIARQSCGAVMVQYLSLIHISEPTRRNLVSRMPSSA